jgi:arylsulfatase A-like enzyme
MITGMYQMSIGAHHHRSSYPGSEIQLAEQIKLLPEIFKANGYHTSNGGKKGDERDAGLQRGLGKTDYNFVWNQDVYDDNDWKSRKPGQPFFAQIQLRGGKFRNAKPANPVDPAAVKLPPYYPDDPVLRNDWAQYLNSVLHMDQEVGGILKRLDDEGLAENTLVIVWTDHGISHARGKQFCYDEGIHVPLVMRWPGVIKPGSVREDLVSQIDIAATSLAAAGLPIPEVMQGRPLLGDAVQARPYVFAGRDRCDETLDCIRCVRDKRYKYIRNFYPDRAHLQPNQYKDGKEILQRMRQLHAEKKINAAQEQLFAPHRPAEELYDLEKDPYEIHNLVGISEHQETLKRLRAALLTWMVEIKDVGLIPEPELGVLSRKHGSAYAVLRAAENKTLLDDILRTIESGRNGRAGISELRSALNDKRPSIRWWGAKCLSDLGPAGKNETEALRDLLKDVSPGVRVAAGRALCLLDGQGEGLPVLLAELKNGDQVVRHYAALALEDIGLLKAQPAQAALREARSDPYEYVQRIAVRIAGPSEGSREKGKTKKKETK